MFVAMSLSHHIASAATHQNEVNHHGNKSSPASSSLRDKSKKTTLDGTFNMASNDEAGEDNNKLAVPNKRARLYHRFSSEPVPPFKWALPQLIRANNFGFDQLLCKDAFFDKSAPLYNLLKEHYDHDASDFYSVPLRLVYTRRFGKLVLLDFIESTFSPLLSKPYNPNVVRAKIASLERGQELLDFGLHPVVCLNMLGARSVHSLHGRIKLWLEHAGLDKTYNNDDETMTPAERLLRGVKQLNDKFEAETGVPTKTIVLIDEYDRPFRDRGRANNDPLLAAITELFCLGKQNDNGISLMVLFGLTRMVSTELNGFVDVSRLSVHHGVCGVSIKELVKCANGQLDQQSKEKYDGQTFEQILHNRFGPAWSGFRFGLDNVVGELDPASPEGALFSPVDAWKLVESLVKEHHAYPPSSYWHSTIGDEFEFTSFADKYASSKEAFFGLCRNLYGGWVDITDPRWTMERDEYLLLDNDLQVKQLLLEVGFLTVKDVDKNIVRLGSPNRKVTSNALELLNYRAFKIRDLPSRSLALEYVSQTGFSTIVSDAAREVSAMFRRRETASGGNGVFSNFPYEDYLYMEMLYRFPFENKYANAGTDKIELYREAPVLRRKENRDDLHQTCLAINTDDNKCHHVIGVGLMYGKNYFKMDQSLAVIIELMITLITECDPDSIYSVHQKNMEVAKERVLSYVWQRPKVAKEQRVVVSGVWCPTSKEADASMELQASFEFVTSTTI